MRGLLRRIFSLTPTRVVALFILLWIGVAVPLAFADVQRPWLYAYGGVTMVYSFFIAMWAMLRTAARLRGVLNEGESPDGGLVLESLPQAAVILGGNGKARAFNMAWLDFFVLARAHVWRKPYKHFCDPILTRAIDRARRTDEPVHDLPLSARTPLADNVFFRADIVPLGDGWLVCVTPERRAGKSEGPYYEEDRLYQFGRVGASLLPELSDRLTALRGKVADREGQAALNDALALTGQLDDLLQSPTAKPATIQPGRLLKSAAQIVAPAFDRRKVPLQLTVRDHLPSINGNEANLVYALIVVLLQALEAAAQGGLVSAHARAAGDDVEFLIAAPREDDASPDARELFTPTLTGPSAGLAVARQIIREHDGNLLHHTVKHGGAQFLIQLPRADSARE